MIDCTGKFLKTTDLRPYLDKCGVQRVVVSAPVKEPSVLNVVVGMGLAMLLLEPLQLLQLPELPRREEDQAEHDAAIAADRKAMVGSGDRSERIRTYNFPQNRVTDHRIGLTTHALDRIVAGEADLVIEPLITFTQAETLKAID